LVAVPDFDGFEVPFDESAVAGAVVVGTAGDDSVSEPDDPESLDAPPSEEPSSLPPDGELVLTAARRSFLAQPEPR
jgi:hypothetical protein